MMNTTFAKATSVQPLDSHTYSAHFESDWCIGTVPHGGYVTSCFLSVARLLFETTRKSYNQPHTVALQLNFVRRTSQGPATFTVFESKLGRRTSTIHVSLSQEGQPACVVGYLTQSNFHTENGLSLETAYSLSPSPIPLVSTAALRNGAEPNWSLHQKPFDNFRKAGRHVKTYLPSKGQVGKALIDQWLCLKDGQRFTQESLGYVADMFPQIVETAYEQEELKRDMNRLQSESGEVLDAPKSEANSSGLDKSHWATFVRHFPESFSCFCRLVRRVLEYVSGPLLRKNSEDVSCYSIFLYNRSNADSEMC